MRLAWLLVIALGLWLNVQDAAAQGPVRKTEEKPISAPKAQPAATATTAPAVTLSPDEQTLQNARLSSTGPGLLEFFRRRTSPGDDRDAIGALVRELGNKAPEKRDKATAELVMLGSPAVPSLREAANSLDDLDTAARARQCLQFVEGPGATAIPVASARLMAQRRPPGAVEVLLAYLPFANDEAVAAEVENALTAVAVRDGKVEPALLHALEDQNPVLRAAAAVVVCRAGGAEDRSAVRRLLKDASPSVRMRAALCLAGVQEVEAIPVLIDLLAELRQPQRMQVENYLGQLAGEWAINAPRGDDAASARLRRELWTAWWRTYDGPVLLEEFRKRTLSDVDWATVTELIKQLGDDAIAVRDRASTGLLALGSPTVPLLRQATENPNAKVSAYARKCMQVLEKDQPVPLPMAAVRLLMLRKPDGAAEVLLGYLPFAESAALAGQVQAGVAVLAFHDGKPDDSLVRALEDKVGARRSAAAELLWPHGDRYRPAVRNLLKDPEPAVRLRAAMILAGNKEKDAVPVLIDLLNDLSLEQGWQVEEFLNGVAGEQAPEVYLTDEEASRPKCRDAWAKWWQDHGRGIDLAKLDEQRPVSGPTLVLEQATPAHKGGRVLALDAANKIQWEFDSVSNPLDVHLLPGGQVLLAEQGATRVTERDPKGQITWTKQVINAWPFACERLRNGNTFIACSNRLLETDRGGKEVFNYNRPSNDIIAAKRFRDGRMAFVNNTGSYTRLDAKGQEVKSFRIMPQNTYFGAVEILPNDHVLVPMGNKVAEYYTGGGKPVREWVVPVVPNDIKRLANGHTLVANVGSQEIVQIDRSGKVVWQFKGGGIQPWRVRR